MDLISEVSEECPRNCAVSLFDYPGDRDASVKNEFHISVTGLADKLHCIDGDAPCSHSFPYLISTLANSAGDFWIKWSPLEGMFVNMLVVCLFQ